MNIKYERAVFGIILIILATLFVFIGKMNADQWSGFCEWIIVSLIVGHTITSSMEYKLPKASLKDTDNVKTNS
jgi:hypothetical protein